VKNKKEMNMNRLHLFEFNDQQWMPRFATSWMTRIMHYCHEGSGDGRVWAPKLLEQMNRFGEPKIVDLCSGGGGPILGVAKILESEHGVRPHITLTDIIPNLKSAKEINSTRENCVYVTEPVDANNVPPELTGVRTVFSGLHHLPPDLAFSLLKNAFDSRQHIFIGETTKRCLRAMRLYASAIRWFPKVAREFETTRAQRFFTYILPILPLMLGWDNVVSCLRTYSPEEVSRWFEQLESDDYHWEVGELWNPTLKTPYQYIMGYPVTKER
jgi:hypothetical protein